MPASLFLKIYVDMMHLLVSGGFRYLVQERCSLYQWPEFWKFRKETVVAIGDWLYENILCQWGVLSKVVTDNGTVFFKALAHLAKWYHINHIWVSGYNLKANGIVERPHFKIQQSLIKAADGDQSKWSQAAYLIFWAERIQLGDEWDIYHTSQQLGHNPWFFLIFLRWPIFSNSQTQWFQQQTL